MFISSLIFEITFLFFITEIIWCPYESSKILKSMKRRIHQINDIVDKDLNERYCRILSTSTTTSNLPNDRYRRIYINV